MINKGSPEFINLVLCIGVQWQHLKGVIHFVKLISSVINLIKIRPWLEDQQPGRFIYMVANGLIRIKLHNHSGDICTTVNPSQEPHLNSFYNDFRHKSTISCKNQAICCLFTNWYCIEANTLQINFTNSSAGLFSGKWDPGSNGNSALGSVLDDLSPDNVCWIFCVTLQKLTKSVM